MILSNTNLEDNLDEQISQERTLKNGAQSTMYEVDIYGSLVLFLLKIYEEKSLCTHWVLCFLNTICTLVP